MDEWMDRFMDWWIHGLDEEGAGCGGAVAAPPVSEALSRAWLEPWRDRPLSRAWLKVCRECYVGGGGGIR